MNEWPRYGLLWLSKMTLENDSYYFWILLKYSKLNCNLNKIKILVLCLKCIFKQIHSTFEVFKLNWINLLLYLVAINFYDIHNILLNNKTT